MIDVDTKNVILALQDQEKQLKEMMKEMRKKFVKDESQKTLLLK